MRPEVPHCPRCKIDLFVRVERVISGLRAESAYYCGKCNHEWNIPGKENPRIRQAERPKSRRNIG